MNMAGVIFSNLFDENFGILTKNRTVASLPYGGRYRFVDFALSNMSNSNITNIGIVTKYNYQSLMDHLGSCSAWDLHRKNGGVILLPPFSSGQTSVYQGKLEALHSAFSYLERLDSDYILLSDTTILCNIDYNKALEAHVASGADITIIANREKKEKGKIYSLLMEAKKGKVTELYTNAEIEKDKTLASMGMFIMERTKLIEAIKKQVSRGRHHLEKDFIQSEFNKGALACNVYEFEGAVLRNDSIASYFSNNLALTKCANLRKDLFSPARPIYTKVRDEVPTYYGEASKMADCVIADGCKIEGYVENAVIFRDVKVRKNTIIKNSIIMQGSVIEEGCHIENAIIDKNAHVSKGTHLEGALTAPVIVEKGENV